MTATEANIEGRSARCPTPAASACGFAPGVSSARRGGSHRGASPALAECRAAHRVLDAHEPGAAREQCVAAADAWSPETSFGRGRLISFVASAALGLALTGCWLIGDLRLGTAKVQGTPSQP